MVTPISWSIFREAGRNALSASFFILLNGVAITMLRAVQFLMIVGILAAMAPAQKTATAGPAAGAEPSFAAERELARSAIDAHGGERLRGMRSLMISGSVDVTTSAMAQSFPATFVTIFAGEKYRLEIANPFQPLKQVYDGTQTSSSIRGGFTLPPINRLGFPILQHLGKQGFVVTSLPAEKRKRKGFRVTSPEGYYTDFYLDERTNQIKSYDSTYSIQGRSVSTSVEIDKYRLVEGVLVPERYAQRFDTEQLTVYANFKAKDISVNKDVPDSVFRLTE